MATKKIMAKTKPVAVKASASKAAAAKVTRAKAPAKKPASIKAAAPGNPKSANKPLATSKSSPAAEPAKRDDMQIGGRLRHARLLAGIRMRELAEKVGCTESMISKLESGRVVPSLPM